MARITYNECSICKGEHKSLRMTIRLKNTQGVYVDVSIGDYILAHNNCKSIRSILLPISYQALPRLFDR